MAGCKRLGIFVLCWLSAAWPALAAGASTDERVARLESMLATLQQRVAASDAHIADLEARLALTSKAATAAKTAIASEMSQPMLLLVGSGPCPNRFTRIPTRVLLTTRAATPETVSLLIAAGIPWEEQPGVGYNVHRDFYLCFRAASQVRLD
jgi:hypothetical protein